MTFLVNKPYYKLRKKEENDQKEKNEFTHPQFNNLCEVNENSNEKVEKNLEVSEIESEDEMKTHQEIKEEGMESMPL
jgi:hypothetical protein